MSHHVGHCLSLAHLHNLCGALWLVAEVWKDLCWLEYSREYSDETLEARERHLVFFLVETPLEILRGSFLLGFWTLELWLKTVCLTFVYLRAFKERWFCGQHRSERTWEEGVSDFDSDGIWEYPFCKTFDLDYFMRFISFHFVKKTCMLFWIVLFYVLSSLDLS